MDRLRAVRQPWPAPTVRTRWALTTASDTRRARERLLASWERPPLVVVRMRRRHHGSESQVVRSGADLSLAARADHVARAVLIGAEERSAALHTFGLTGFCGIE